MKYSMMSYSVARQTPPGERVDMPAICDLAVEMGLDALDQVTCYGYEPADLKRMAHDRGLQIICYTQSVGFRHPPGPHRDDALDAFHSILDTAMQLEAPMIMLPITGQETIDRHDARRHAIDCLAYALPLAQQAGVTLTVEHFPNRFSPFIVSDDMQEALDALPELRITFDNGNVLTGGEDPVNAFRRHCGQTVFAHFKDWTLVPDGEERGMLGIDGRRYERALIGEGIVDYPALVAEMQRSGYAGYVNLEYEGDAIPAATALRRAHRYLLELEAQMLQSDALPG